MPDVQSTVSDGRPVMLDSTETTSRFVDRLPSAQPRLAVRGPDPDVDAAQREVEPPQVHAWPPQHDGPPVVLPAAMGTVTGIVQDVLPGTLRAVVELDADVAFHHDRLVNPPRIYLDLHSTRLAPGLTVRAVQIGGAPAARIRVGHRAGNTVRIVLDATDVSSYRVYWDDNPRRLVVECVAATPPGDVLPDRDDASTSTD